MRKKCNCLENAIFFFLQISKYISDKMKDDVDEDDAGASSSSSVSELQTVYGWVWNLLILKI